MPKEIFILLKWFVLGIGLIFGLYSLTKFQAIMLWIKEGIENGDGILQNSELQIAFFSLVFGFEVVAIAIWGTQFPVEIIYATAAGAGLMYTANRVAHVMNKNNKEKPTNEQE